MHVQYVCLYILWVSSERSPYRIPQMIPVKCVCVDVLQVTRSRSVQSCFESSTPSGRRLRRRPRRSVLRNIYSISYIICSYTGSQGDIRTDGKSIIFARQLIVIEILSLFSSAYRHTEKALENNNNLDFHV